MCVDTDGSEGIPAAPLGRGGSEESMCLEDRCEVGGVGLGDRCEVGGVGLGDRCEVGVWASSGASGEISNRRMTGSDLPGGHCLNRRRAWRRQDVFYSSSCHILAKLSLGHTGARGQPPRPTRLHIRSSGVAWLPSALWAGGVSAAPCVRAGGSRNIPPTPAG